MALAGVMGGKNTEINDEHDGCVDRERVFQADKTSARTIQETGLAHELVYRFERGGDVDICDWASRRAAQLICETAGGQSGQAIDNCPHQTRRKPKELTLHFAKTKDLLGIGISHSEQVSFLTKLGLTRDRTATRHMHVSKFRRGAWI